MDPNQNLKSSCKKLIEYIKMATESNGMMELPKCAANCGFYAGGVSGYCSKCARIYADREPKSIPDLGVRDIEGALSTKCTQEIPNPYPSVRAVVATKENPSRCTVDACTKKLGLLGFTCKCGKLLCATHRHPEDHSCDFDHKAHGREKIASDNPVISASKIDRI